MPLPGGGGGGGNQNLVPTNIEDEMKRSYLDYAMSVIVGRALPDIRDGLKPVHRRISSSMLMGTRFRPSPPPPIPGSGGCPPPGGAGGPCGGNS